MGTIDEKTQQQIWSEYAGNFETLGCHDEAEEVFRQSEFLEGPQDTDVRLGYLLIMSEHCANRQHFNEDDGIHLRDPKEHYRRFLAKCYQEHGCSLPDVGGNDKRILRDPTEGYWSNVVRAYEERD